MDIRSGRLDDLDQLVVLNTAVRPYAVGAREGLSSGLAAVTDGTGVAFAAELDGQLIGWSVVRPAPWLNSDDAYSLQVIVHPDHRRQGIGTQLLRACEAWLEARSTWLAQTIADEHGIEFARRAGFTVAGELTYAGVELDGAAPTVQVPEGLTLVPLSQLTPRDVFPVYRETAADIPGGSAIDAEFDWYESHVWSGPLFDPELSVALVDGGVVVAFSIAFREETRLWTDMTGTASSHRGRGLAGVVKAASLAAARNAGVTAAYTMMNLVNEPMLTVNRRLGYRPVGLRTQLTKSHRPG
ncbi:GNAT family N-acetyltransferase [Kribbella sp. NPDC058245]|uniref:GNAT family N-acetyltransferase n=1 Tax=Kribbella sp. NPDC058245 TaxID=3346399 RepID=UPI0036E5AD99